MLDLIVAGIGAATSIFSAISGSQAQSSAESRNAAELARQSAETKAAYERKAADEAKKHARVLATQRAMFGASGLSETGTPILVQMESLRESEEELERIRQTGETESSALLGESRYRSARAGDFAIAGYLDAGRSLVGGLETINKKTNWW